MTFNSMTGFARSSGGLKGWTWQWELRSVNGKALDVRFRLPPGCDQLEPAARARLTGAFRRGSIQVSLSLQSVSAATEIRINEDLLQRYIALAERIQAQVSGSPLQAELLLALRGVVETGEESLNEEDLMQRDEAMLVSLDQAVTELSRARSAEGDRLKKLISDQISRIAELAKLAEDHPSRTADSIRARLSEQVMRLLEANASLDQTRLYQEAALLAVRADIQEELDRLAAHVEAAHMLLASQEPVGRKLDFLAQEFNREANTLCSKASDRSLTAIGIDLKTVIDQMREQIQNIE